MVQMARLGIALQPIATALFANSPFRNGEPTGYLSWRSHVWTDTVGGCISEPAGGWLHTEGPLASFEGIQQRDCARTNAACSCKLAPRRLSCAGVDAGWRQCGRRHTVPTAQALVQDSASKGICSGPHDQAPAQAVSCTTQRCTAPNPPPEVQQNRAHSCRRTPTGAAFCHSSSTRTLASSGMRNMRWTSPCTSSTGATSSFYGPQAVSDASSGCRQPWQLPSLSCARALHWAIRSWHIAVGAAGTEIEPKCQSSDTV